MRTAEEIFKDVVGYERIYKISNFGRIVSYPRNWIGGKGTRISHGEIELKTSFDKKGYKVVGLIIDNKYKMLKVHRLVASAFIPNLHSKPQVNHINGIKHDNRVENLEWVTHSENQKHARKIGLTTILRGEDHPRRKLSTEQVIQIFNSIESASYLANKFNVHITSINGIRNGYRWSHITKSLINELK